MSAIQTNVGLITGIPIQETVEQLISISARPRDTLVARTQSLQGEQAAVNQLSSLVLSLQFSLSQFNSSNTFDARTASSSDSSAVSVSVANGGAPVAGSYQFTPLQVASSHQLVSGSFDDITDAIGDGALRFGFGGHVDKGLALRELNGGAGVPSGSIRITDANGSASTIDLRAAQNVDDVLIAINSAAEINVTASTDGDRFILTDNTGGSGSLEVRDIGLGTTAASLGLTGTPVGSTLTGEDVLSLSESTRLSSLNDGGGVRTVEGIDDLTITLRDGTTGGVNLSNAATLGDVIDAINNDEDFGGNLVAEFSGDGESITLRDDSGGSTSNFIVANGALGSAASDLRIEIDSAATTVTSGRLLSGLRDTFVASLNGGQGFTLGSIDITDSVAGNASIDLSGADTLDAIVDTINASGSVAVTASINANRNGIVISDDAGGQLTIADGATAEALGIQTGASTDSSVDSGSLNRQVVSEATRLTDFNGGAGVELGDFRITDSAGDSYTISLDSSGNEAETIGDVIDAINNASGNTTVTASINETGDGILLTDTASGSGDLTAAEVGDGTTAADLKLLGASTTTNESGQQTIDGSTRYSVDLSDLTQDATAISLASLNGGDGVDLGVFQIVAADGQDFTVNLGQAGNEAFTVGDVIDRINDAATAAGVSVTAAVNTAGTGIELTDGTGGSGQLEVVELNGSLTPAADLNLIRTAADSDDDTIDGAGLFTADDGEQGALATLAERINALNAGVTASVLSDINGFRLSLTANNPGVANELLIDSGADGLSFTEISRPTDSVAIFGSSTTSGGIAVASTDNTFNGVVNGLDITVNDATGDAVNIEVASDTAPVVDAVQDFVDAYNSIRANLDSVTTFDSESATTGILFGRNEAIRVDTDLSRVVSGNFFTGGSLTSLESIGVSLNDDGTLTLSTSELQDALANAPSAVEELFTDETSGVVAKLTNAIDLLATNENSLLSARSDTLQRTIDNNNSRITDLSDSLDRERDRLLLEFFRLEETIALLQTNLDAISTLQPITPLSASSSNS